MEWILGILGILLLLTVLTDGFSKGNKQQGDAYLLLLFVFVAIAAIALLS